MDGAPQSPQDLEAALLDAHDQGERRRLVTLYGAAAERASGQAQAFFLTQAYVIALEIGDPRAPVLRAHLVARGAETDPA